MFFPASWAQHDHMEVEMFPFFLSLLANQLSWKETELWKEIFFSRKRDRRGKKYPHGFQLFFFPILASNMKTSDRGRLWLKLGWNMLMPWFCFHLEPLLGGGSSFDFHMHGIAPCEPPQHVFLPSDASPSTYLWAIIWGHCWMFILAEIPSCIHAYFLWSDKWPLCVMLYKNEKSTHAYTTHKMSPPQQFVIFKRNIFCLLFKNPFGSVLHPLDGLNPLHQPLFNDQDVNVAQESCPPLHFLDLNSIITF